MTRYTARVTRQTGEHGAGWLVFHDVGEAEHGLPETYLYATYHPDNGETEMLDMPGYFIAVMGDIVEAVLFDAETRHEFEIHNCKENAEA